MNDNWKTVSLTLQEALALRLPNGTPLGEASAEELEAEAARIKQVAEAIRAGGMSLPDARMELANRRLFAEAFRVIDEAKKAN